MPMLATRASLCLGMLFCLLAGCGAPAVPPALQSASVSGRVYDALSNKPIAGATVTINSVLSAVSDASGLYTIAPVPDGPADWFAQGGNGYGQTSGTLTLTPGQKYLLNIPLTRL